MNERSNAERAEAVTKYTVEIRSINEDGAIRLRDEGLAVAREMGVPGFLAVYSRTGMEETTQVQGAATLLNVEVARAKIKTVLAVRRSSRLQRERMAEKGQTREDFGGQLGSLFGGGIALFADEARTQFIGAMAFSGGTQEEDEEICRRAVERIGLYTDVDPVLTQSVNEEQANDRLQTFTFDGEPLRVSYQDTEHVAEGVECDVYRFEGDDTKDLGIIKVKPGFSTPRQRVLDGDRTIEGYMSGKGKLIITKPDGTIDSYSFDQDTLNFTLNVRIGEIMQWQADTEFPLVASEVCFPPYNDDRYERVA